MIERISKTDAVAFLRKAHYLAGAPSNANDCFGWVESGKILATAVYGPCHVPKLHKDFIELRRLAAISEMTVPLSKFLAQTMRSYKSTPALITWADPDAGHHGGIYQATNWVYCAPRSYNWNASYRLPDGSVKSHRDVFSELGTSAKAKVAVLRPEWKPFLPAPKHRYIYPLAWSLDECLRFMRARALPYPKPDHGDAVRRPGHKERQWSEASMDLRE